MAMRISANSSYQGARLIDTFDLLVFTVVARTGSIGRAATELSMAGPSVSARIASLEHRIGATILDRGARGSTLTPAGERLLEYAIRCLDLLDEASLNVPEHRLQRLVLAAPASIGDVLFAPALAALTDAPVKMHWRVAHSGETIGRIIDGSVDAGFAIAKVPSRGLITEHLGSSSFIILGRPQHPHVVSGSTTMDALVDTPIIAYRYGRDAQRLIASFEHPRRFDSAPIHTTGSPTSALRLAAHSDYLAVVPAMCAQDYLRAGQLQRLDVPLPGWSMDVQFIHSGSGQIGVQSILDQLPQLRAAVERVA